MVMDRYYAFDTPEALAFRHLTENLFTWDLDHPSLPETIVAGCAAYVALQRYLTRPEDVIITPRSRKDISRILHRYSIDEIHNILSSSRRSIEDGGYSRICHLAEVSIAKLLDTSDNAETLLAVHHPRLVNQGRAHVRRRDESPGPRAMLPPL
jgi:hypothetical protein